MVLRSPWGLETSDLSSEWRGARLANLNARTRERARGPGVPGARHKPGGPGAGPLAYIDPVSGYTDPVSRYIDPVFDYIDPVSRYLDLVQYLRILIQSLGIILLHSIDPVGILI